jgi:ABC-type molybdate transport system substrate-binding protein
MQPNRTTFFIIIGLAVVIVLAMVGASFFLAGSGGAVSTLTEKVSIQVVAAPAIKPWLDQVIEDFQRANANIQVKIVAADALVPTAQFRAVSPQTPPPAAWLAEASFVVDMAREEGLQFDDNQSVASTSLAWGAYNDKLNALTQEYGSLSWDTLHTKAISPAGLKLVIASPHNSAEGLATLISAAAAHLKLQKLSESEISAADAWLTELLGNRNAQTPPLPATAFASVQGRTLGDLGLLSLASWRSAGLDQSANFLLTPAESDVILDYPFAIWAGPQASPEAQEAARTFRRFLLEEAQQSRLANFSFEPAAPAQSGVQADGAAAIRLQQWAERVLR